MTKLMTYVMCQRVTGFATVFQSQVSGRTFMTKGPLAFVAVALLLASSMETSALGALQSPYSGRGASCISRSSEYGADAGCGSGAGDRVSVGAAVALSV